jgi:CBS domain-containing protein
MTRVNNTRSSDLREQETRQQETREEVEYTFEEQDALHIPEVVINRFANAGMTLGWLRMTLKGKDDVTHIGKKLQEGWQFVDLAEVPEMSATSVVKDDGRYAGVVSRGDVGLAKIPTGKYEARSKYYRDKSKAMNDAINSQLMGSNNSRMPISNNSKSKVITGRQPNFQD